MDTIKQGLTEALLSLLEGWQAGRIVEREVQQEAERILETINLEAVYPESAPVSLAFEVLVQLDALNQQLVTLEDVPLLIDLLKTPVEEEEKALSKWNDYWNNIDYEERRSALRKHPYYRVSKSET